MASEIRGLVFMFAIFLAVFVSPGTGYDGVCLPTWSYYSVEKMCIRLFVPAQIWSWAKKDCQDYDQGSLVIIHDANKNTFVKNLISFGKAAWIGASRCSAVEVPLSFVDGSQPNSYHPIWNYYEAIYREDCLALTRRPKGDYWFYRECYDKLPYVCQMKSFRK